MYVKILSCNCICNSQRWSPRGRPWPFEVFEVLGLEASSPWPWPRSPRKLPCPRLEDSIISEQLKFRCKTPETSWKICEHLFCFPHLEHKRRQGEGGPPLLGGRVHLN